MPRLLRLLGSLGVVVLVAGAAGGCASLTGLGDYSNCSGAECDAGVNIRLDASTLDHRDATVTGDASGTPSNDADTGALSDAGGEQDVIEEPEEGGEPGGDAECDGGGTSVENCGGCGVPCTTMVANAQPVCTDGVCSFTCASGFNLCGGACVELTGVANCGSCGNVCSGATGVCATGDVGF
jgi:hypothetical protein